MQLVRGVYYVQEIQSNKNLSLFKPSLYSPTMATFRDEITISQNRLKVNGGENRGCGSNRAGGESESCPLSNHSFFFAFAYIYLKNKPLSVRHAGLMKENQFNSNYCTVQAQNIDGGRVHLFPLCTCILQILNYCKQLCKRVTRVYVPSLRTTSVMELGNVE